MPEKRCINCGISFNTTDTVAGLDSDKKELLKQWIPEIEVLDTHPICRGCIRHLYNSEAGATRSVGHPRVCINCGCSTAQKIRVLNPRNNLFDYVMELARERLPDSLKGVNFSQICYKCVRRFARLKPAVKTEVCLLPAVKPQLPTEQTAANEPTPAPAPRLNDSTNIRVVQRIQLSEYKRVKASTDKCVVRKNCEGELRPVPLRLRQTNLVRRALYVPHGIKLCTKHSRLPPPSNVSIDHSFSGEEIADMLFLLKCTLPLEANGMIEKDMCIDWLGIEFSEFKETLKRCGKGLLEAAGSGKNARQAMAAYFLKKQQRHRNCDTVLASLLECDPKQVQTLAKLVEECLKNSQNGTELRAEDDNSDTFGM